MQLCQEFYSMNNTNVVEVKAVPAGLVHPRSRIYDCFKSRPTSALTTTQLCKILQPEGYTYSQVHNAVQDLKREVHLEEISGSGRSGDPLRLALTEIATRYVATGKYPRSRSKMVVAKEKYLKAKGVAEKLKLINSSPKHPSKGGNTIQTEILRLHKGESRLLETPVGPITKVSVDSLPVVNTPPVTKGVSAPGRALPPGLQILWRGQVMSIPELKELHKELSSISFLFSE
jgi:hypothetical protein